MAHEALTGRRILITGAAGGVGRETAALMIEAGANVVSADMPGATHHAEGAIEFSGDLARQDEVERLFHFVDDQLGGLDVLVACVGLPADPLMAIDDTGWRQVIDANLVSYLACTKKAIDRIRTSGRDDGQIILVGSISVHIKAVGESVYNAAKGGVAPGFSSRRAPPPPPYSLAWAGRSAGRSIPVGPLPRRPRNRSWPAAVRTWRSP